MTAALLIRFAALSTLLLGLFGAVPARAEGASGTIKAYECGDNCYLTITRDSGEEVTGLCAAPECQAWNEVAEMPAEMIGRWVAVTIEMGQQTDNEGNLMGEFPAFTQLSFHD